MTTRLLAKRAECNKKVLSVIEITTTMLLTANDCSGREVESCSQVLPTGMLVAVAKRWRNQTRSHCIDDDGDNMVLIEIVDRLDDCSGREVEPTLANC